MNDLFDDVIVAGHRGIIIGINKKKIHTYYDIVFEDSIRSIDDWQHKLIEYSTSDEKELVKKI